MHPTRSAALLAALCLTPAATSQEARLVSPDPGTYEIAGTGLALDGDRIAVGEPHDASNGEFYGAVHVYERGAGGWSAVQKLRPAGLRRNDAFGTAVVMQGDTLLVGAIGDDQAAPGCGRVYAYERVAGRWNLVQELAPADPVPAAFFGDDMALDGDTVLIGARFADGPVAMTGAAYVFVRRSGVWMQQAKLVPNDGRFDDSFGAALDLSGDTAVIGMHGDDTFGLISGAAYVFRRTGTSWVQSRKLLASDGAPGDMFGFDVAIDGARIVVGAPRVADQGPAAGAAYVFEDTGSGFVEVAELLAADGSGLAEFGRAVDVRGGMVVVGAPRRVPEPAAYVFHDGHGWKQTEKLVVPGVWATSEFADVVETDGVRVAAGAPRDTVGFYGDAGSAYVFALPRWTDLGNALPRTNGVTPRLNGFGRFAPGNRVVLRASGLPAAGAGLFVFGFRRADTPWFSGTLVPAPDVTVLGTVGPSGAAGIDLVVPAGLVPGFALFVQTWGLEPATLEVSATNAVVGR